ncbi:MAG: amino acid racemase [Lachnospiraceae bacterium]|nr:amino acid racemase [Lachnospiraceae bacterium]
MKKLGIIGGLGPMATVYFLQLIVEMTDALTDQEHIEVLLHSRPQIPDRTKFILGVSRDSPVPYLVETGVTLAEQGAELIAIPCITAHFFQNQLEEKIGCPMIHTIEETADYLRSEHIHHVGIMATDGTIKSELFQQVFAGYDIVCTVPQTEEQGKIMHIIYDNVKAGLPIEMDLFEEVSRKLFAQGAEVLLLGCTELSLIKGNYKLGKGYLDVMEVLARRAVLSCGKLKSEYQHLITR